MKSFATTLAFAFVLTGFLSFPQVSHAGLQVSKCHILGPICTQEDEQEVCLLSDVNRPRQVVSLMACYGMGNHVCYKQVVFVTRISEKECVDCEAKCQDKPEEKQSQCLTECSIRNDGCVGTEPVVSWKEVGEMSCVVDNFGGDF